MGFVSSCRLVVASPPRRRGPQVRAPWHHEGHGAVDVVGPVAPPGRASGHGWGTQECTQIGGNDLSAQFRVICVHCCAVVDRRENAGVYTNQRKRSLGAVLGHLCTLLRHEPHRVVRASTAMACRRRPLGSHLSPGRENRPCTNGAAASLASSPRRQPTQTPEEP